MLVPSPLLWRRVSALSLVRQGVSHSKDRIVVLWKSTTHQQTFSNRSCHIHPMIRSACVSSMSRRAFSSFRGGSGNHDHNNKNNKQRKNHKKKNFQLDALPFSISPEEALSKFRRWAEEEQGLKYLLNYQTTRIGAAYVPVWSFDLNIRYKKKKNSSNESSSLWLPPLFQEIYNDNVSSFSTKSNSVIHLPGLSAYAGYFYRRSLVQPVHSTCLTFLGDQTEPFGAWMLRDMKLHDGSDHSIIEVHPDAWNATQGRALQVVKDDLQEIAAVAWEKEDVPRVQVEVVKSRRVYLPTFVVEYQIAGLQYKAFISGCDEAAPFGGVSHQIFGPDVPFGGSSSFLDASSRWLQTTRSLLSQMSRFGPQFPFVLLQLFRPQLAFLGAVLLRILTALPAASAAMGMIAGYRKVVQPWMDQRTGSAEWERQREHEAQLLKEQQQRGGDENSSSSTTMKNDFFDSTEAAQRYFRRHKAQILRGMNGEFDNGQSSSSNHHTQGEYDWYSDWQKWARQQWEQQQQQQQGQQHRRQDRQQQQQQQQRTQQRSSTRSSKQQKKRPEYQWDFNEHDPYSVLGIHRGVSAGDVSKAFRKEMLKHHPDAQPTSASEAQKQRSLERSKLISEAYRKIKTEMK